jgi:cytochrome c556
MKAMSKNIGLGIAATIALMSVNSASAWWYGDPWYRPYGSGAVTYERQTLMRDHGWAMQDLASMFEGRRAFDRDEAVRLARRLEAALGDKMLENFAPGTRVAGSRVTPWVWRDFGAFRGYAIGARQAAEDLAGALEQVPDSDDVERHNAWMTSRRPGIGRWSHLSDDLVSMQAIQAYTRLNANCHSCHVMFRGGRW